MASTAAFLQAASSTSDASTYTFSSQNFGTAGAGRYLIVGILSRKSGAATTINSVTIGGVSATEVVTRQNTSSNCSLASLYIAAVPTGASGDVVVTFAATMLRCSIQLYSSLDLTNATAYDTDSAIIDDPTVNLDCPANGFIIGVAASASSTTTTWSGITEDSDAVVESALTCTAAHDNFAAQQTGLALTANFASPANCAGVFASWPAAGGSTPISQDDSATGTDAASVAITSTSTETGAGVDAVALQRQSTSTETGSGADSGTVAISSTSAETGSGVDAVALQRQSTSVETASGTDAASLAATLTATDTGSGVDAASVSTDTSKSQTETGSGSDTPSVAAAQTTAETAAVVDTPTVAINSTVTDSGAGVDAASVSADTQKAATDTASGLDAVFLAVAAILAETASGTDAVSLAVTVAATDTATVVDACVLTGPEIATRAAASDSAYGGAVAISAALVGAVASDSEG